ncbi:dihydropteroate synthase [Actinomycetospora sp. TBRC 11914]|uniref:dihydropteroate synthase n=1 Tax=Actinomycetospora sp. TBRC 11914 TaxID=2729387 RepID=UPI00145E8824|nr:dihydropteroate synthase [Actinomycetospora sp. TBRC 11914]NMO90967.1 dihydropteroate synthase [Actinomycetospora sp. TBRC 11914]
MVIHGRRLRRDRALIMAIVNRTPDSFYDNGATWRPEAAEAAVERAVEAGADVVDLGGVPASPGPVVSVEEEIDRVRPTLVWARERFPDLTLSIDTYRAEVAEALLAAGGDLVNDSWAGWDEEILPVTARHGAGYVCAHTGGLTPRTDPVRPRYTDVMGDVVEVTTALARRAAEAGVPAEGILLDPTIDFGKNTPQSLEVLREMPRLVATGWPVLLAMSNKGVVGETLDVPLEGRLTGTLAATALAAAQGVAMVRAHQVEETRQTVEMVASVLGHRPPSRAERWMD